MAMRWIILFSLAVQASAGTAERHSGQGSHSGGMDQGLELWGQRDGSVDEAESWNAFLKEAAASAHHKSYLDRQDSVSQQVAEEMELDLPLQSHFDMLMDEDVKGPSLSAMAAETRKEITNSPDVKSKLNLRHAKKHVV
mmetsp:Transcript_147258/g.256996  ORF Transcript_147258/g.256996 Transcript_147258/m.256996 type:complete len:139 (+) Transcript_147258:65-481(+)